MDRASVQERFGIIGSSDALRKALDRVRQVAGTEITVLIQGESGVGKEHSGHALFLTEPIKFQRELKRFLKDPL